LLLKCRKDDVQLVKELIPECEQEYQEIMKREAANANVDYKTKLKLMEADFLTNEQGGECGGIVLTSLDRRIVCNNTLKSRLDLCFEELLPHIRQILFPPKVVAEPSSKEGTPEQKEEARKS